MRYLLLLLLTTNLFATDLQFNVSMRLLSPIVIANSSPLVFPDAPSFTAGTYVVNPSEAGAASFTATGEPNKNFHASITSTEVVLSTGNNGPDEQIVINKFTLKGPNAFNDAGIAKDLRVGATAHIKNSNVEGNYRGIATYRIVY